MFAVRILCDSAYLSDPYIHLLIIIIIIIIIPLAFTTHLRVFSLLSLEVSRSHNDTTQSVGLLWTSDQPVAETST